MDFENLYSWYLENNNSSKLQTWQLIEDDE